MFSPKTGPTHQEVLLFCLGRSITKNDSQMLDTCSDSASALAFITVLVRPSSLQKNFLRYQCKAGEYENESTDLKKRQLTVERIGLPTFSFLF